MFNLDQIHVYTWHRLFLMLSLERTQILLQAISFPTDLDVRATQPIFRAFVKDFYNLENLIFSGQKISSQGFELFSRTYDTLSNFLGQNIANEFCQWGNLLKLDKPIEKSLLIMWNQGFNEIYNNTIDSEDISINIGIESEHLKILIYLYNSKLKVFYDTIDKLEVLPKDDWDAEAYRIYNIGSRREDTVEILKSPLEYLEGVIEYVQIREAVYHVGKIMNKMNIGILTNWLDSKIGNSLEVSSIDLFKICENDI